MGNQCRGTERLVTIEIDATWQPSKSETLHQEVLRVGQQVTGSFGCGDQIELQRTREELEPQKDHTRRRSTSCNITRVSICWTSWTNRLVGTQHPDAAHGCHTPSSVSYRNTWRSRPKRSKRRYTRTARRRGELHAHKPPSPTQLGISSTIS